MFKFKDYHAGKGNLGVSLSELDRLTELFAKSYELHLLVGRENRQRKISGGKKGITPTACDNFYAVFKESGLPLVAEFKTPAELPKYLAKKIETVFLDVRERDPYRPKDKTAQKAICSGKQRDHPVKNTVICDQDKYTHFLGGTT